MGVLRTLPWGETDLKTTSVQLHGTKSRTLNFREVYGNSNMRIALDTSCLNVNGRSNALNKLEALEREGRIALIVSTVNEKEQRQSNDSQAWKQRYLDKLEQKGMVPEVGYWDLSLWGALWADEDIHRALRAIFGPHQNPREKDWYDFWLLETAIANKCDVFLTLNTRDFVDGTRRERIETLGIKVRTPEEFILEFAT